MLSDKQLQDIGVMQWSQIEKAFNKADLLLGNGFSIRLAEHLAYPSLFEKFLKTCDAGKQKLLAGLNTTNFEEIQRMLLDAKRVVELLDTPIPTIDEYVTAVREGLIKAIHESHPRAADMDKDRLREIARQLNHFGDVFTTNYDLFLYHIIMFCKDLSLKDKTARPYNDYFWNRISDRFLRFMGYQNYPEYKHAYFLHGALFIFSDEEGGEAEVKLVRGDDWELLDAIDGLIRKGNLPLFVTEGTAAQKARAIAQSPYLRFAQLSFRNAQSTMVIYGSALGAPDRHIVEALNSKQRTLAVSVYVGEKDVVALDAEVKAIRARLSKHPVVVFDSRSLF